MNPKGLVEAASMTSHGSTPIFRHAKASSLARAMLTLRKVFSRSLAVSATRGLEASNTLTVTWWDQLTPRAVALPARRALGAPPVAAPHHFRDVGGREPAVPRIDPLGREGQEDILPDH